jgi:hypothetical protein
MTTIVERLVSWAQNEEMVDGGFTQHGHDCLDAAALAKQIDDAWVALYGGQRTDTAKGLAKRLAAIVDDRNCGYANWQASARGYNELDGKLIQERDIRTTREVLISLIAQALGVEHEPHQTFFERVLEAARKNIPSV